MFPANAATEQSINLIVSSGRHKSTRLAFEGGFFIGAVMFTNLIMNGTATTTLVLSEAELDELQQKIVEINLFSYPDVIPKQPDLRVSTLYECSIQVQNGDVTKEVSWDVCSQHSSMLDSLDELEQYIIGLVEQTPEYQALPEAVGGYI